MKDNFFKSCILGILVSLVLLLIVASIGVYYSTMTNIKVTYIYDMIQQAEHLPDNK